MQPVADTYPDRHLLDYARIRERCVARHADYIAAQPFAHAVLDDFIAADVLDLLLADLPRPPAGSDGNRATAASADGEGERSDRQGLPQLFAMPASLRQVIWELNSGTFLRSLEKLTGIDNLIPDPSLLGGGLRQLLPGESAGVHADLTHHEGYRLGRRVSLLLYLNRDWRDEYAGHLELWSADASRCVRRLRPSAGRCVVFNTGAGSYYGHPRPLACPRGMTHNSIALHYYTVGRDDGTARATRSEDWREVPEAGLPPLE